MTCSAQVTAIHVLSGLLQPLESAGSLRLLIAQMQRDFSAPSTADEVRSNQCSVLLKEQYLLRALLKACSKHLAWNWLQVVNAWGHTLPDLQRQGSLECADLRDLLCRLSATMAASEADDAVCPVIKQASTSNFLACPCCVGSIHHCVVISITYNYNVNHICR